VVSLVGVTVFVGVMDEVRVNVGVDVIVGVTVNVAVGVRLIDTLLVIVGVGDGVTLGVNVGAIAVVASNIIKLTVPANGTLNLIITEFKSSLNEISSAVSTVSPFISLIKIKTLLVVLLCGIFHNCIGVALVDSIKNNPL